MRPLAITAAAGRGAGVLAGWLILSGDKLRSTMTAPTRAATWNEVSWPFPTDQFGRGRAFACSTAGCGTQVTLYVRAKVGFCNCTEGVSDDAELERIGDLELLGRKVVPQSDGRAIAVAWMKGRSRPYALTDQPGQSVLTIGYNDRCDAIVATAVVQHDRPDDVGTAVIAFLNSPTLMRWAAVTLGL